MKPVDQDLFGRGVGNCYAAASASILEWELARLRVFHRLYVEWSGKYERGGTVSYEERLAPVREAARLGWHAQHVHFGEEILVPRGYSIANGPGPRDCDHSCVALDGPIVHDPHPAAGRDSSRSRATRSSCRWRRYRHGARQGRVEHLRRAAEEVTLLLCAWFGGRCDQPIRH